MESIIPLRSASSCRQRHGWVLALAIGVAASLSSVPAFAQVPKQAEVDAAEAAYDQAVADASANIPDSNTLKAAEDALDAAARAMTDAEDAAEAAKVAGKGATAARRAADKAHKTLDTKEREADAARAKASQADKERAEKYREALRRRRAARLAMERLVEELKTQVQPRRAVGGAKELEVVISHLRGKMTEAAETIPRPLPPRSEKTATRKAGNKSYPSVKSNVSTDSQKHCTFGKAGPVALLFEPADGDGNPLDNLLPAGVIEISNPDPDAPKPEKKKEGGAATTADAPQGATPSNKRPPDKAADAKTPAKPTSLDMLGGSILDQIEPTPQQPGDRGMFPKLPNGKVPEEELDRLTKLAEAALVRGDRPTFESYREEARAIADSMAAWITKRADVLSKFGAAGVTVSFRDDLEGIALRMRHDAEIAQMKAWWAYYEAVVLWGGNPSSPPGSEARAREEAAAESAKGTSITTKTPTPAPVTSDANTPAGPPATSTQTATPAAEGKPGQAETSKTEPGKTATPAGPPSQSATPGEKSAQPVEKAGQKAELADKMLFPSTPVSTTPAESEASGRNITIHFKVEESVLKGGAQGDEIKGKVAKLITEEPELPKTGRTRTAKTQVDKGYDKSPVTCVTDGGRCKAVVPADERDAYGLSVLPPSAASTDKMGSNADLLRDFIRRHGGLDSDNYSVALSEPHTTGVVLKKTATALTPKQQAALADAPTGVMVSKADFKVGGKSYTRIGITGPPEVVALVAKALTDSFGKDAQIDLCDEKAPGPPLGMTPVSFSALNRELPHATLDLRTSVQPGDAR